MTASTPLCRGRTLVFVGVVLVAFSLRSGVAALSPILSEVEAEFAVAAWAAGLIGAAPPVCFAVFGIVTPTLERRFGLEQLTVVAMIVITAAIVGRALATNAVVLLVGTVVLFAAVGVGNVVLPPLIKTYFPDRMGTMTSLYSAVMAVAAFVPPLVAVPVADAAGWRTSLGMWAAFSVAAIVPWIAVWRRHPAQAPADLDLAAPARGVLGRLARLPLAWALAVSFSVTSASVYVSFAWLPAILVDIAGASHAAAGALLSLFGAMGMPLAILAPIVVVRWGRIRTVFAFALVTGVAGVAGLLFAPASATVLWVVLLGCPQALFAASLVLIQLRTRTREGAVALSGFAQGIGYTLAAIFPLSFAMLHETTGSWQAPLVMLGAFVLLVIPAGVVIARTRTLEEAWERRHGAW
ncbi:MAG: MFS transporter [Microbacterium sp.]